MWIKIKILNEVIQILELWKRAFMNALFVRKVSDTNLSVPFQEYLVHN